MRTPGRTDEGALADDLFRREWEPMRRLALALGASATDADDVVQDAFGEVWSRWDDLDRPAAYLRTTVVHGVRRRGRREANRRRILEGRLGRVEPWEDRPDHLLDALDALPDRQRAALVLAYYADLSVAEIAEVLGCRPGTVKSLVHRGVARLRKVVPR